MGALPREVALAASGQRGWNSLGLGGNFGGGCDAQEHAARNKLRWDVKAAASQSAL